jgi:hypothetical protein
MKLSAVKFSHVKRFIFLNFVTLSLFVSVAGDASANASANASCYPVSKPVLKNEATCDWSSVPNDPCDTEPAEAY